MTFLISCKSKKNVSSDSKDAQFENLEDITLEIVDYEIKDNIEFDLKLVNNTNKSIYIVHPNRNHYNSPDFFRLKIIPDIEVEEVVIEVHDKPLSEFIKIAPKSKLELPYISEKYDINLKDKNIKGKILEFRISYNTVQYWESKIRNMSNSYSDNEEILKKIKKMNRIELLSNTIKIRIPE